MSAEAETRPRKRRWRHSRKERRWLLPVRERLLSGLVIEWETGCLLWEHPLDRDGYGKFQMGKRLLPVHRVAWELEFGPVPEGLELDHVWARGCRHRNCANVAHLEPVTHRENQRRRREVERLTRDDSTLGSARRCDHPATPENTYTSPAGAESCRPCNRDAQRRYKAKKKQSGEKAA